MKYPGKEKDTCYYEISDGQHFFKDYLTKKNGIVSEGWKGLNSPYLFQLQKCFLIQRDF